MKTLDKKLKLISAGKYTPAQFILADAKDPDMAVGVHGMGPADPTAAQGAGAPRTRPMFLDSIRAIVRQKQMDIMLASASNIEALSGGGYFAKSAITPAIRANDTTDIWLPRGASYSKEPSRPFRSASLMHASKFCDLGLYSVTFNNILDRDYAGGNDRHPRHGVPVRGYAEWHLLPGHFRFDHDHQQCRYRGDQRGTDRVGYQR